MTKHEYICAIADVVRSKSDCYKRKVGAVFVNADYEILATGYNAPPRGFAHCDMLGNFISGGHPCTCGDPCIRTIHAEMNGIVQAAKRGTALKDSTLYCTYTPCVDCSRLLVNLGVVAVRIKDGNHDGGFEILTSASIDVSSWDWKGLPK